MTASLWVAGEPMQLGGTLQLYAAMSAWDRACGGKLLDDWPALGGVVTQVELQEDADPDWLDDMQSEAADFLAQHEGSLPEHAAWVLEELSGGPAANFNPHHGEGGRFASGDQPVSIEVTGAHKRAMAEGERRELKDIDRRRKELRKLVNSGQASARDHEQFARTESRKRELVRLAEERIAGAGAGGARQPRTAADRVREKLGRLERSGRAGTPEHQRLTARLESMKPGRDRLVELAQAHGESHPELLAARVELVSAPPTHESLRTLGASTEHTAVRVDLMRQVIGAHSADSGQLKMHGMASPETMRHVDVGGLKYHFSDTPGGRAQAAESLARVYAHDYHPAVLKAQTDVVFASQPDFRNAMWAVQLGIPGFRSAASGGDGRVVVYERGLSAEHMAHEAGHNIAFKEWGDTQPAHDSPFMDARMSEGAVSDYGSKNPAEAFAEAVMHHQAYPVGMRASHPRQYAEVRRVLDRHG